MNFVSVMSITAELAREQAAALTGYPADTIGPIVHIVDQGNNNRQKAYIFETSNDVTLHPNFARASLYDLYGESEWGLNDGPVLSFGPEVTVGG